MFLTHTSDRIQLPASHYTSEDAAWTAIRLEVPFPHFNVHYQVISKSGTFTCSCYLMTTGLLIEACQSLEPGKSRLVTAQLISPPWMNGSDYWQMHPLQGVDLGTHATDGEAFVFMLRDGKSFTSLVEVSADQVRNRKQLISF